MTDDTAARVPAGIDADAVSAWMADHTDVAPPLRFTLIAGGHSNLTFRVDDAAGRRWALRRPPLGQVLATAHDMGREHRIISALAGSGVPVPATVGLSPDDAVNGAPFYVMAFVEGTVVRDAATAETFPAEARSRMAHELLEVLARLHAVDVDAVGLGDLGRKADYIPRQLKRWSTQFAQSTDRDLPAVQRVHDILAARIPEQQGAGIVHGDYRLDNCMVGPDGSIAAVLDWELCTLGDVLADLGSLQMYWGVRGSEQQALQGTPTLAEGIPSWEEVFATYAARSDRDLSALPYYVAFAYWRGACIIEGVYNRYKRRAMGDKAPADVEVFGRQVEWLLEQAVAHAEAL
ncbi:MAG: phosphotransferase family protein [Acidimicrobiales bacterium]|jgi:aminoglycoside phosphotransferase (APT) family kinase protein|nr:phosphotransferase family protein [Acidimicrobiales bacterium]